MSKHSALLLFVSISLLAACGGKPKQLVSGGGGGNSGGSNNNSDSNGSSSGSNNSNGGSNSNGGNGSGTNNSPWVSGTFKPATDYQSRCANPRSGTNPATGEAYSDKLGSLVDEKNWLRSWNDAAYLWYNEVIDQNPENFSDPVAYFNTLKTQAKTTSGKAKDQFHFTLPTKDFMSDTDGATFGYGATITTFSNNVPRSFVVSYTQPDSPASHKDVALKRGTKILEVNGIDIVNTVSKTGKRILDEGLFPKSSTKDSAKEVTFKVLDAGATEARTVKMKPAKIIQRPVLNVKTIDTEAGKVGYMLFNEHIASAEKQLIDAVNTLKKEDITDLVLDLRYNGGGIVYIANELASMIAIPENTKDRAFMHVEFNDKYPNNDPFTGEVLTPTPFLTHTVDDKTKLPHLGLSRVFVLTGSETCSASELIMNSLRGVDVNVIQIGSTTCGKPYGYYPTDNCGTTYFSVNFESFNGKAIGGYADGFSPENLSQAKGKKIPGCFVEDDYLHDLGDKAEKRLSTALHYRASGKCPTASEQQKAQFKQVGNRGDGVTNKPAILKNMIMLPK